MVLKLYANSQAVSARLPAVILHEKQVPYELVDTKWEEVKEEKWLKIHPFGDMPYIDDDGFTLYESLAIARYIATKYASQGTPLLPAQNDPATMATIDQAISIAMSNFDPYVPALVAQKIFLPKQGMEGDGVMIARCEGFLNAKMVGFERLLSKQKYIAGDTLTFVDFFFLSYGSLLAGISYDYLTNETKYPNVVRWFNEISGRESWKKCAPAIPPSL